MRAVKGYVVLAILLLIPTMGYFQKQHFERRLKPELAVWALEVLRSEGVEAPAVEMRYLDAVISGRVTTESQRVAVAERVDALPGVRVTAASNRLRTFGWIRVTRVNGAFRGEGLVPPRYLVDLPEVFEREAGWDAGVVQRENIEIPRAEGGLTGFFRDYFEGPGNRSVELQEERLMLRGDATAGLRSDWLSKASEVVEKDQVMAEFTLHPSIYHFPGYRPVSLEHEGKLEELRRQLEGNVIDFGASHELTVPDSEQSKVTELARTILQASGEVQYAVGGHPGSDGNVTVNGQLARKRAALVTSLLEENGVDATRLEVVSFGVTPDGTRDNQVEVVVK